MSILEACWNLYCAVRYLNLSGIEVHGFKYIDGELLIQIAPNELHATDSEVWGCKVIHKVIKDAKKAAITP